MYDDVQQIIPSGAKGRNAYQGSHAVQQSGDVGPAGGEPSGSGTFKLQTGNETASEEIASGTITSGIPPLPAGDDDSIYGAPPSPSLPPPTPAPSPSKRRSSALEESVDDSSTPTIPASSSASALTLSGNTRSANPYSSKRGKMTGAIALSSLGHELSGIKDMLRTDMETSAADSLAFRNMIMKRKRQEPDDHLATERLPVARERSAPERLGHEHLVEPQDLAVNAICHMQEVDSDLPIDDQAALVDLFEKENDSAKTYLALKSDALRRAWIKRKITASGSGV